MKSISWQLINIIPKKLYSRNKETNSDLFKVDFSKIKVDFSKIKVDFSKFNVDFSKIKVDFSKIKVDK